MMGINNIDIFELENNIDIVDLEIRNIQKTIKIKEYIGEEYQGIDVWFDVWLLVWLFVVVAVALAIAAVIAIAVLIFPFIIVV